jgi:FkbM family methyltransferase
VVASVDLAWPPGTAGKASRCIADARDSDPAIALCDGAHRRRCIQAGGHIGLWALRLAEKFAHVVTFEPEPANYACLVRNTADVPNIVTVRGALAEDWGTTMLAVNPRNSGKHKLRGAHNRRTRDNLVAVDLFAIDRLGWTDVDLIILDVEGCELRALIGAERTIERCKPVLMLEEWGHLQGQGHTPGMLWAWLEHRGYREAAKIAHDHIWVPA